MSLQWTLIATFLYTEIGLCVLLMIPFISPARWQKIFKSKLLGVFRSYANLYFNIFIVVLVALFIDAIRDVQKYSSQTDDVLNIPNAEVSLHMKLFRAQRNFYIALFALFLFVVIRRLVTLLSTQAKTQMDYEVAMKQAQSASDMAKKLLEEKDNKGNEEKDVSLPNEDQVKAQKEISQLKEELRAAEVDVNAMKSQAQSTSKAYDDLLAEKDKLEKTVETLRGAEGSKKDE